MARQKRRRHLPPLILVQSSAIHAVGYDPAAHEMVIVYIGASTIYLYHDVIFREWADFWDAPSAGRYVNDVIKDHRFDALEPDETEFVEIDLTRPETP